MKVWGIFPRRYTENSWKTLIRFVSDNGGWTDKAEFYATVDLSANDLRDWQHYYNWERPHSAQNGKTPMERYFELAEQTPYSDAVRANYQPSEEHVQEQNYKLELELRKLKRCL